MENIHDEPLYLVPFISDYGFKHTFADPDSSFAKKAIQILAHLTKKIEKLTMLRSEFTGMVSEGRAGIYDVFCRDEESRLFILELQGTQYEFYVERLLYYIFTLYNSMVKKGIDGFSNLKPIICICIVENRITDAKDYYEKFMFRSEKGTILHNDIEIHLIELGKFDIKRKELKKVITEKEELIYTMKYGHQIDLQKPLEVPLFWDKEWLNEAIAKLDQRKMTPEERAMLDIDILQLRMNIYNQNKKLEDAEKKAREEGEAKGLALGKAKGLALGEARGEARGEAKVKNLGITKALQQNKLTVQEIAELFDVSKKYVLQIQKELKPK